MQTDVRCVLALPFTLRGRAVRTWRAAALPTQAPWKRHHCAGSIDPTTFPATNQPGGALIGFNLN